MRLKVLITTVLGLAVFYCRSVVCLETGYKYSSNEILTQDQLHDDLKCTHLFSGYFHMRLIGYMFHYEMTDAIEIINMIRWYNTRSVVYIMYVLDKSKVGVLWLLHVYVRLANGHYNYASTDEDKPKQKKKILAAIISTHEYVIDLLQEEIKTEGCRGNSFDRYDKWIRKYDRPNMRVSDIERTMFRNFEDINSIIKKNTEELTTSLDIESFNFKELFMNNIGSKNLAKLDLMNVYNVQVNWSGTNAYLLNTWENAQILDWTATKLQTFKKYYKLVFHFLKVIFFRLSLKHVLYIEPITGPTRVSYVEKWDHFVLEFGNMLHIGDDPHIAGLRIQLAKLMNPQESIKNVKEYLEEVLFVISKIVKCDATSPMILDGNEFKVPYREDDQDIADYVKSVSEEEPVEFNSLANVKAFMLHLTKIFKEVDFSVLRSLVDYFNEKSE